MKLSSGIGAVAVLFALAEDALGHGYVQQIKAGSEYIEAWNPYKVVLFFQCKSCHLRSCFFFRTLRNILQSSLEFSPTTGLSQMGELINFVLAIQRTGAHFIITQTLHRRQLPGIIFV